MAANPTDPRLIWFTRVVTLALIVACNGLLVVGWWVSGVNLDAALSKPAIYDMSSHYCVGVKWMKVEGADQLVKVCAEWLDLSDPSGATHSIREGHPLKVGVDGTLHYADQQNEDYRLLGLVLFIILTLIAGMWVKSYLIAQYAIRLQSPEGDVS